MSTSKIETWIKAGYELLATEGLKGIKIERLARILNLNKSGFYYYFGAMDGFLRHVLQHHARIATEVAAEIEICETIDPDLLLVVLRHPSFFLVESQLLVKGSHTHADYDADEAGKIITKALLSFWQRTHEAPGDEGVALAYLNIIRHFFYARIDAEKMTYEFLHDLAAETRDALGPGIADRHVRSSDADRPSAE